MITYDKYMALVSRYLSNKSLMTQQEKDQIKDFELRQPLVCPRCNRTVWTPFERPRIAHDVEACTRISKLTNQNRDVEVAKSMDYLPLQESY